MIEYLENKKIILASASPRRQELLKNLDINFDVFTSDEDEQIDVNLPISEQVMNLAKRKCLSVARHFSSETIVIGGDTIVCVENQVLGKPSNRQEAIIMLKNLSGKEHSVFTGIAVTYQRKLITAFDEAKVHFLPLTKTDIDYYVDTYKPFDKAGSYGIQEWIGLKNIDKIEGSFYTIMGLPTHLLSKLLEKIVDEE